MFEKIIKLEREYYQQRESAPTIKYVTESKETEIIQLRDTIDQMSNRVSTEVTARDRREVSLREYINSQILQIKEEFVSENKSMVESHVETTREVNESLQSLYELVSQQK